MPTQFVNPAPNQRVERYFSFDFPCAGIGEEVEQPPASAGLQGYCPYVNTAPPAYGNVNLRATATEALFGKIGYPKKEQGHPFIREKYPESEDPDEFGGVGLDQTVDIDRGFFVDHTGRLSGSFIELLASKPHFSVVEVSAAASGAADIPLARLINWLEPESEDANVWYWRVPDARNELLYTAHVVIEDPTNIIVDGNAGKLISETVYHLTFKWKFYKWIGNGAAPDTPPDPRKNPKAAQRLGISGFDEAMRFEVIGGTEGP